MARSLPFRTSRLGGAPGDVPTGPILFQGQLVRGGTLIPPRSTATPKSTSFRTLGVAYIAPAVDAGAGDRAERSWCIETGRRAATRGLAGRAGSMSAIIHPGEDLFELIDQISKSEKLMDGHELLRQAPERPMASTMSSTSR